MTRIALTRALIAGAALLGLAACGNNPVTRTYDRTTTSDTSGAYPQNKDASGNPVSRTYDKATTSDTSGAFPQNK